MEEARRQAWLEVRMEAHRKARGQVEAEARMEEAHCQAPMEECSKARKEGQGEGQREAESWKPSFQHF